MSEFGQVEVTSTPAERSFFRALSLLKLYTGLQYHIYSGFRQTSKNFWEGGLPKHILEKNTVFWKKGVEIWAFDGSIIRTKIPCPVSFFDFLCFRPSTILNLQQSSKTIRLVNTFYRCFYFYSPVTKKQESMAFASTRLPFIESRDLVYICAGSYIHIANSKIFLSCRKCDYNIFIYCLYMPFQYPPL